ncbi:hypothetical protein M885DRAFT_516388 [Pelagophyceae sp. CCMP2097]|nr:hypothetical protein M885DRAFT_516388 [Pelagophyceae sp. CCMP2097]
MKSIHREGGVPGIQAERAAPETRTASRRAKGPSDAGAARRRRACRCPTSEVLVVEVRPHVVAAFAREETRGELLPPSLGVVQIRHWQLRKFGRRPAAPTVRAVRPRARGSRALAETLSLRRFGVSSTSRGARTWRGRRGTGRGGLGSAAPRRRRATSARRQLARRRRGRCPWRPRTHLRRHRAVR